MTKNQHFNQRKMQFSGSLLKLSALFFLVFSSGVAQEVKTINGKVIAENDGMPMPGTNVLVKGTTVGTQTDFDGNYSINASNGATLVFSYLGYTSKEISVNGKTTIDVSLAEDASQLDEVVVVGYGTQKKESLTNAISSVKGTDLVKQSNGDLRKSLQGLAPGLTVVDNGGQPGSNSFRLNIRGVSSINNSAPLILVDNIVQSSLSGIDPNTIESVSILKDAASTAIYGSRGANGIILITTKKGSKGKVSINLDSYYGTQAPTIHPRFVDTEGYMRYMTEIDNNSNGNHVVSYTEKQIQDYLQAMKTDPKNNPPVFYDWDDIYVKAPQQNYSLTVSGGGDFLKSMANISYFDQDGVYANRNFKRFQTRLNNTFTISDKLSAHINFFGTKGDSRRPNGGAPFYFSVQGVVPNSTPFAGQIFGPDGEYWKVGDNNIGFESDPDYQGLREENNIFMQTDIGINWEPIEGLKYQATFAYQSGHDKIDANTPKYTLLRDNGSIWKQNARNGLYAQRDQLTRSTLNQVLSYEKLLGRHALYGLVGYSEEEYKMASLSTAANDFLSNDLRAFGSTTNILSQEISNNLTEWGLRSFFGRLRYGWDGKYLFELSARYDGSSRFRKENRYTLFPAASAAWHISKEKFWQPLESVINNFKIRYSWGVNGNQNVAPYERFPALQIVNNVTFGDELATGVIQRKAAGENIIWEETSQHNVGLDVSFMKNKLDLTLDYFDKRTENILLKLPVAATFGLAAPRTNAGIISNKGWEAALNWKDNVGEVNYSVGLTFADVQDKITDFAGLPKSIVGHQSGIYGRELGTPVVAIYGYRTDGFFDTQEEIDESAVWGARGNINPGDIKYKDISGPEGVPDGVIDGHDIEVIGDTTPRYSFGLNLAADWNGFDFTMIWQGAAEVQTYLQGYLAENGGWANSGVTQFQVNNHWEKPGDIAYFPLPQSKPRENVQASEQWALDADYIRCKVLSLGYSFPENITNKLGLSKLRVYYNGNNLYTISGLNKWGIDPEDAPYEADYLGNSNRGLRHTYYSQLMSNNIGITIGF